MLALLTAIASAATLAVLPFDEGSAPDELDGFGHALSAMITTDLTLVEGVTVVERSRLDDILGELDLSKTTFVDKKTAVSMGRGLAADHVVTGVYSVVGPDLVIDARIIHVESGKVAKAGRAQGPMSDFVDVEKQVMDLLVADLELALSGPTRRKIIGRSDTDNLDAFSSYGKGLLEQRQGRAEAAQAAFESALAADPAFEEAQAAVGRMRSLVAKSAADSRSYRLEQAVAQRERALAETTSERDRKPGFRHDERSIARWLLRLEALRKAEEHCVRYDEMLAYLEREGLPDRARYDYQGIRRATIEEGIAVGRFEDVAGWKEHFAKPVTLHSKPLPWEYGMVPGEFASLVNSAPNYLWELSGWAPTPSKGDNGDGLLHSLHQCFEDDEEVATLEALIELVRDDPQLNEIYDDYEVLTAIDVLEARLAATTAWKRGPSAETEALVEKLLAAAPEGTTGHFRAQGLAKVIVSHGERWTREQRKLREAEAAAALSKRMRLGLSEEELVGMVRAIAEQNAGLVHTEGLCAQVIATKSQQAVSHLDRLKDTLDEDRDPKWTYDGMWQAVVAPRDLGCLTGTQARFATVEELYAYVDAIELPAEPSKDCRTWVRSFASYQNPGSRMDPEQFPGPAVTMAIVALDEAYRLELLGCVE